MKHFLLGLLFFLFSANFLSAQQFAKDHSDCGNSMEEVTESNLGPITLDGTSGNNTVSDHKKRSLFFFYKEHNIAWLKFRVQKDTLLTFDIIPHKKTDDVDFLLFRYTGGDGFCDSLRTKKIKPIRTNISKPDSGSNGQTGLSTSATQDFVPWGKGPAYSKALSVKKGEIYYLVLDNFTEGGQDVSIENLSATSNPAPQAKSTIDAAPVKVGSIKVQCPLTISVVDEDNGTPIKGILAIDGLGDKTVTIKDTSSYSVVLGASQSIAINCNSKGYFFYSGSVVSPEESGPITLEIKMKKIKVGSHVTLKNIKFEPEKAEFLVSSKPSLLNLVEFMNANPTAKIEIQGYVNSPGTRNNFRSRRLSKKRAKAVKEYLILQKITKKRLHSKGYGNTNMIYPNPINTEQSEANRRVEIMITYY
ncbi:MAG: OmpA family protein [Bacteroidia bacterium]